MNEIESDESKVAVDAVGSDYSTWFIPEGEVYTRLSEVIINISDEFGTPKFEPHVTLLGGLTGLREEEAISRVTELARNLEPLKITLTKVSYFSSYSNENDATYRSLFILPERTKPLMEANHLASKTFGKEGGPPYYPHLSIMYGSFTPETKERIISKVGREFSLNFEVKYIYLWSVKGLPEEWKLIKKIPLVQR